MHLNISYFLTACPTSGATHLWYFVAAFMFVDDRHSRLGGWAVNTLGPPLYGTFWSPSFCDQECQEHQELLSIILKELLRCF